MIKDMKIIFSTMTILFLLYSAQSIAAQKKAGKNRDRNKSPLIISCGVCNQEAVLLPKPEYSKAAQAVNASGAVNIEILIDENGDVESAKAVSGHLLLQSEATKAAYKAKFKPLTISGKPVKVRGTIVYYFASDVPIQSVNTQLPIINGMAKYLPKLNYSQEAKEFCADGKVEVEVLVDEQGIVIEAKAISGNELLQNSAIEAVKKARFLTSEMPVKIRGIVVFNFVSERKCFSVGIVNNKAKYLPKPFYSPDIKIYGFVKVLISIDMDGKVTAAKAVSGHSLLRPFAENAARQAKFAPTLINGGRIYIKAQLLYNFKSDHTVETVFSDGTINGKPKNLPKPPFPSYFNGGVKKIEIVNVEAEIDENGNIIIARAISGHPVLRQVSESAARASKFSPTKISGVPVKAKVTLKYEFKASRKWSSKVIVINFEPIKQ